MIRRLTRWTLGLLASAFLLLVAMVTAVVCVMNTEAGTRWAIDQAVGRVPFTLELGEYRGTLWRGLDIDTLTFENEAHRVEAGNVILRVDWSMLTANTLVLRRLRADAVRYVRLKASDADRDELSALPIEIRIRQGDVAEFRYEAGERPVIVESIAATRLWTNGLEIRAATADAVVSQVGVSATDLAMVFTPALPITSGLSWRFGDWSGRGRVDGSLEVLRFEQDVDGPYPAELAGTAELLRAGDPVVELVARWDRWDIGSRQLVNGDAGARGWIDDYTMDYTAEFLSGDYRLQLEGSAAGSIEGFDRFDVTIISPFGRAVAAGDARWVPSLVVSADVEADGEYAGYALNGDGSIDVVGTEVGCRRCRIASGRNELRLEGRVTGAGVEAQFAFDVPDLDDFAAGFDVSASGRGELAGPIDNLRGRLAAANIRIPGDYEWALRPSLDFGIRDGRIDVDAHEWTGSAGNIVIDDLQIAGGEVVLDGRMSKIPLALANAWLPGEQMRLSGEAAADIELQRTAGEWVGRLNWQQSQTLLRVTEASGEIVDVRIPRAVLDARLQGGISLQAEVEIEPGITGRLEAELDAPSTESTIEAKLDVAGDDWNWLPVLVPQVDNFEGSIRGTFVAAGPLMAPELSGELRWQEGGLVVPSLNVPVTEIDLVVSGGTRGTAWLSGTARAGDGELRLAGRIDNLMRPERSLELTVAGDEAAMVNWPEYRVWASPELTLAGNPDAWRITGKTAIPRAEIRLREIPEGTVEVSPDVVVLGADEPVDRGARLDGEVAVILGDRVHINALGLEARLRGNLVVILRSGRPMTAQGRIVIEDGRFESYGQKLTIRDGELIFTGPLDDPIVNVRAVRIIETFDDKVTAGLHLTGRASDLTTTVFSEPPMAEADALSYLVVGRPLNQATEAEGGDLSGAALALGVKQASRITEQIGQSVGLDQLSLTGDGGDATALVAGKQLNERLYARYAYGIFSRVGMLLLRYRLNEHFTLEAGTGDNQSIDIVYSVER